MAKKSSLETRLRNKLKENLKAKGYKLDGSESITEMDLATIALKTLGDLSPNEKEIADKSIERILSKLIKDKLTVVKAEQSASEPLSNEIISNLDSYPDEEPVAEESVPEEIKEPVAEEIEEPEFVAIEYKIEETTNPDVDDVEFSVLEKEQVAEEPVVEEPEFINIEYEIKDPTSGDKIVSDIRKMEDEYGFCHLFSSFANCFNSFGKAVNDIQ